MITKMGLKGDTNRISIVPVSFSLTMETDVIKTQTTTTLTPLHPEQNWLRL
jgi:hypothetical protein